MAETDRGKGTGPVTIAVAPNGGRRTKADHPALPQTAQELGQEAAACLQAGAAMFHMHVRDRDGAHFLDADAYRDAIHAVRQEVGDRLVIQITTEAVGRYQPKEQVEVVKAVKPEAASLALKELVSDQSHEAEFGALLAFMKTENIVPQIILYHPDEARQLKELMARDIVPFDDIPVLYVLGRYTAGQRSAPADLLPFIAPDMPRFSNFMVCAFGAREAACVTAAALLGGHARVGFENNLHRSDGQFAANNAENIAEVAQALKTLGLGIADADRLRADWAALMN